MRENDDGDVHELTMSIKKASNGGLFFNYCL